MQSANQPTDKPRTQIDLGNQIAALSPTEVSAPGMTGAELAQARPVRTAGLTPAGPGERQLGMISAWLTAYALTAHSGSPSTWRTTATSEVASK